MVGDGIRTTLTPLTFGEWVDGDVYEHMYVYYSIEVSASLQALEVVIVPESGDPEAGDA